jgi:hypothetical protein
MAFLYITEFSSTQTDINGHPLPMGAMPPIAEQTLAIGAVSAPSAAFNTATRFVRLAADSICSIAFGTAPVAAATNLRLAANAAGEYFAVTGGQKVAVLTNT